MECPRCSELVDPGAAYCGNCGAFLNVATAPSSLPGAPQAVPTPTMTTPPAAEPQPNFGAHQIAEPPEPPPINTAPAILAPGRAVPAPPAASVAIPAALLEAPAPSASPVVPASLIAAPTPTAAVLPAYAAADPHLHKTEGKAMTALILSILAVPGSIVPFIGWTLAIIGIVLATSIRSRLPRKAMSNLAIGFASLAVLLSSAVFVYNISEYSKSDAEPTSSDTSNLPSTKKDALASSTATTVDTPCYTLNARGLPHIDNTADSCQVQAYNDTALNISTNALNIEGVSQDKITSTNLDVAGKEIANNYLRTTAPDLVVTSQSMGTFAKSPAYIIRGTSGSDVTLELALVVHKTAHGENVFVIAHAINDTKADLSQFESSWVWK